ncbi:hypothetical protein FHR83_001725 [Actinoplanes campanulatus]|uniref:DUF4956 domain-containing protein n=1 Tax=Actinoplanes campanulatus TaxID=113559 RepID=A0A7W5FD93_9ACTN|nr:DUF4956 domain-containing protein [Actinoplanes campanulatus]MBB3094076.1 hypothetical protein [Actinoplanes campanulatus]GGN32991.1 DUF4956 domain-containing protein [Actinoplanes campanulatus]GID38225.1 DUF4956 domain-containing protein [Actinoplanes campanulatus]
MSELALLGAELVAVTVLVFGLYFPRHRRRDLVVAYFAVNIGVLAVADALRTSGAGAGLGLGFALFGVLSIIRLRSTELDQHEVAYFFSALALGLLGALETSSIWRNIALMGLILVVLAIVDNRWVLGRYRQQIIVLDSIVTNEDELIRRLEDLLGAKVYSGRLLRVDLINDSTVVDVRYAGRPGKLIAPVSPPTYAGQR